MHGAGTDQARDEGFIQHTKRPGGSVERFPFKRLKNAFSTIILVKQARYLFPGIGFNARRLTLTRQSRIDHVCHRQASYLPARCLSHGPICNPNGISGSLYRRTVPAIGARSWRRSYLNRIRYRRATVDEQSPDH